MKSLVASAFALLSFVPFASANDATEMQKRHSEMLAPTVQISRNCSGVMVSSTKTETGDVVTTVLTAKHCVGPTGLIEDIYIPVYRGNRIVSENLYKAKVDRQHTKSDLATYTLLDNETVFDNVAHIAPVDVELFEGEDVYSVGYSRGFRRTITEGLFGGRESIAFPNPKEHTEYFRSTAQIAGGNSGGGLYRLNPNTNRYEIIGITNASVPPSDFMNYYATIDDIHDFLSRVKNVSIDGVDPVRSTPGTH